MEAKGSCSLPVWTAPKKPLRASLGKKMWAQDVACSCGWLGGGGQGARGWRQSCPAWVVTLDLSSFVCARAGPGHPAKLGGNAGVRVALSCRGRRPGAVRRDSISLRQALGAIQLLEPVGCLCGLQWEVGQSPVWGEACGKQEKSQCRCSELMSALWLNHSQVSTQDFYVLGLVGCSTAGSRSFNQLGCTRKTLCRCRLHWDENPLAALVCLIQRENLNTKGQHLFTSS